MCGQGGEGRGHIGGSLFARVRAKLFWCVIYCNNPRPNPESQTGSRSRRGLGRRYLQIMREYALMTAIEIWLLTHIRMCEMGSSGFSTTS